MFSICLEAADGTQVTVVRLKTLMATRRMGMMKSSTLSTFDKLVTLSTTRCTESWSRLSSLVCG
jgi:hypothetical protein